MRKMYAVKNDQGKWLCIEDNGSHYWSRDDGDFFYQHDADTLVHVYGGQVVPLIEAPAKVVVSEAEAEMLERAKDSCWPAHIFDSGAAGSHINSQDRLMRAYVNGWTVEKQKRWNVKVPHTEEVWYFKSEVLYYKSGEAHLMTICPADKKLRGEFTAAEIEHYGLQDCERVEVNDDEQ